MSRKKQLQVFPTVKRPTKVQIEKLMQGFLNNSARQDLTENERIVSVVEGKLFIGFMQQMKAVDETFVTYWVTTLNRNLNLSRENDAKQKTV